MTTLMKTCSSCGLQKPLSAFLQMTGPQGTAYGNICATCRKTTKDKGSAKEAEEGTKITSGLKVDSKAKVKSEADKRQLRQAIEEQYYEERDLAEEKQILKTERVEKVAKEQKEHRKSFLDKPAYLDKNKQAVSNPNAPVEVAEREAQIDLGSPHGPQMDTYFTGKIKKQGVPFQAWLDWVGNSPMTQAAKRRINQLNDKEKKSGENVKDALDYAEKTWEKNKPKRSR